MKNLYRLFALLVIAAPSYAGYQVIQDESGNAVSVTGNRLDVNANVAVTGSTVTVNGAVNATVTNFPAVQQVGDNGGSLTIDGSVSVSNLPVTSVGASTVTLQSVTPTVAVTLATSNPARLKLIVFNETGTLMVKLGSNASATSYTFKLIANETKEIEGYYGEVSGRKVSGTTNVAVTEL